MPDLRCCTNDLQAPKPNQKPTLVGVALHFRDKWAPPLLALPVSLTLSIHRPFLLTSPFLVAARSDWPTILPTSASRQPVHYYPIFPVLVIPSYKSSRRSIPFYKHANQNRTIHPPPRDHPPLPFISFSYPPSSYSDFLSAFPSSATALVPSVS